MYIDYNEEPFKWLLYTIAGSVVGLLFSTLILLPGGLMTAYIAWAVENPSPWSITSAFVLFCGFAAGSKYYG